MGIETYPIPITHIALHTMNRIDQLFKNKQERILNVYFTAGYPGLDDTVAIMESLQKAGADLIEVGIPFSDPVADGPTIQESNVKALNNGMTLKLLLDQLSGIREKLSIPFRAHGLCQSLLCSTG